MAARQSSHPCCKQGFSLLEIVVVLVIIGILIAVAIPNFFAYIEKTRAQTAQNNLLAISAAQEKFFEDSGNLGYCTGSNCTGWSNINTDLHLTMSGNDPFQYSCSAVTGSPISYTCIATDNVVTLTLNPNSNHVVTCQASNNNNCPPSP